MKSILLISQLMIMYFVQTKDIWSHTNNFKSYTILNFTADETKNFDYDFLIGKDKNQNPEIIINTNGKDEIMTVSLVDLNNNIKYVPFRKQKNKHIYNVDISKVSFIIDKIMVQTNSGIIKTKTVSTQLITAND